MVSEHRRPDPDELLARVKVEEAKEKRGKLKIFLGYAPGVGKTYTMLEAAQQRRNEADVVVALVEAHGRAETESLLRGLEVVPRMEVEHRGVRLAEMDVDAVIKRQPSSPWWTKLLTPIAATHVTRSGIRTLKICCKPESTSTLLSTSST